MEDHKKTSEYLYEDEDVFLTEENELFLKGEPPQKISEISEDEVESTVEELKGAFAELKEKVNDLLENEAGDLNLDTLNELEEEVKNTDCIGDVGKLIDKIKEQKTALKKGETEESDEVAEKTESIDDKESSDEGEKEEVVAEESEANGSDKTESVEAEGSEEEKVAEDTVSENESDEDEEATEEDSEEDPVEYYRSIVEKAQDLAKQTDWPYVSMELDKLSHEWSDGPETDSDEVKKLFKKFNEAVEEFEQRKEEHYEQLNKQKEENFETKKKLLEEFEGIISNETWTATKRVSQIKGQWNSIGPMPSGKGEGFDERFEELLSTFNEHKVDRLVQQRQKREDNLMVKLTVLEKMERVAKSIDHETENWEEIDEKFEDLTNQWKKIGRVPKEKANEVWERYKNAQDEFYDRKYRYNPEHQSKVDSFTSKKENLIEEAESLLEADDLATAARKINKLHRRWKKVGNLPQRAEDKLWSRFKEATDEFNKIKSENQEKIKKQEEKHYEQKLELIDKANEIKHTDDFEKGHSQMQNLMDRWKEIGPVARNKSNKIWKQFKGAMDEFYDRRRDHFKEVKEERKENLEKKKEILEKLRELGQHEDPIEAVDIAKGLQEKFKNVGYVPIKHKNEMWKQYREVCDVIYDRMRAAKSGDKFDQELAKADLDTKERNQIQKLRKEYKKVKKEARSLEKEVLQFKEKKTYFKPSSGGNSLLDQVEEKIEKVEQKLEAKQQKMDDLTEKMDEIRAESN
ncbi:DUF349 domain-containing protein [Aliifodinibius salicampi]|uniref:DUF349 domain-containing protein n=1 Tax=Fodinibius salicampi TaxID=1920655 RepID=A0ABT3PYC6_9BACT|nr:DUF349 domain-containing protein [Fodinibius salicampi]MCW9712867.1 DUF349 domain-containing protein [Fodinibius salicampi]